MNAMPVELPGAAVDALRAAQDLGAPGRDVKHGYCLVQAKAAYSRIATMGCNN